MEPAHNITQRTEELEAGQEISSRGRSQRWFRIIPVALVMYTIAFIDRTNISLALPRISRDLHLDPQQAALDAGIFFLGYPGSSNPSGPLAIPWRPQEFSSWFLGT